MLKELIDVKLWLLYSYTWNRLTVETIAIVVFKQISSNHENIKLPLNYVYKELADVKLWLLYSNSWNRLSGHKMNLGSF